MRDLVRGKKSVNTPFGHRNWYYESTRLITVAKNGIFDACGSSSSLAMDIQRKHTTRGRTVQSQAHETWHMWIHVAHLELGQRIDCSIWSAQVESLRWRLESDKYWAAKATMSPCTLDLNLKVGSDIIWNEPNINVHQFWSVQSTHDDL